MNKIILTMITLFAVASCLSDKNEIDNLPEMEQGISYAEKINRPKWLQEKWTI